MSRRKIGILGGGQLGRMLIQAAPDFDCEIHVMDPSEEASCKSWCHQFTQGDLWDAQKVVDFGKDLDVVTIEIELVSIEGLKMLKEKGVKVYPQPEVVEIIQNKRQQKLFYTRHNIPTAPYIFTDSKVELNAHHSFLPAVHKLAVGGYDGKGVQVLNHESDLDKAFEEPALLEKKIPIEKELGVIVARNAMGEMVAYPAVEMVFHPEHNLVDYLLLPADIPAGVELKAQEVAKNIAAAFDIIGLLAVELFYTKKGDILVNEVAPRPHNSGHVTIEASYTSQFQQLIRILMDMPLGDTNFRQPAAMINLLGAAGYSGPAQYDGLDKALSIPQVYAHLYGKAETRPHRKMGHATVLGSTKEEVEKKAKQVQEYITIRS